MPNDELDNVAPNDKDSDIEGLKHSIEHIIGADTKLKRRKKTIEDIEKDNFIKIIENIEKVYARSCLTGELNIDTTKYDEGFYSIIDDLIDIHFGKAVAEVIAFYLYDRIELDGSINTLYDENHQPIKLDNATDLYFLVRRINQKNEANLKAKK